MNYNIQTKKDNVWINIGVSGCNLDKLINISEAFCKEKPQDIVRVCDEFDNECYNCVKYKIQIKDIKTGAWHLTNWGNDNLEKAIKTANEIVQAWEKNIGMVKTKHAVRIVDNLDKEYFKWEMKI